jgi:dTDP-D-glucose 4,6-dehydratase
MSEVSHEYYIGKQIRDLVKNTPDYAINFYLITYGGNVHHLKDILDNEEFMNAEIKRISDLAPDYTYWVTIDGRKFINHIRE